MFIAYYDDNIGKYQEQRKELEMNNVFEERIKSDKDRQEIVWYTEKSSEGDRVKIREHLVDYVPVKADATLCMDETGKATQVKSPSKIRFISQPKAAPDAGPSTRDDQTEPTKQVTDDILPETLLHGKQVLVTQEQQIQKEITDDSEITRKIKDTKTVEQEHKLATIERKVFGVKPKEMVSPKFTKKIQPCQVHEREKARFECEFFGNPNPEVTWYRDNYEITSSDDFKVCSLVFHITEKH